jgi:hypothetical protein
MNPAVKAIQVDEPNAIAFVWEPGNATRYEMAVVRTADQRVSVCIGNFQRGCELSLHCFTQRDRNQRSHLDYLGEKIRIDRDGDILAICDAVIWASERMEAREVTKD